MGMYDGMLPVKQKEGYRGYYPVTNKVEWDELPDLYKAMEWTPIPDPFDKKQPLRAVKNVIFEVVHMEPYGISAEVSVHPQEIQKILFCHHKKKDCQLYAIRAIELEGGTRLPAKWLQDPTTGSFEIVSHGKRVATQGGYFGFVPEHMVLQEDGSYKFDFKYGVGKTTHYSNLNPFRNEPIKEIKVDTTKQLMDAVAAYGLENNWNDSDIIDTLVECGVTHEDFKKYGKEDFVKDYFNTAMEPVSNANNKETLDNFVLDDETIARAEWLLKNVTYIDMNEEELRVVSVFELNKFAPLVDEMITNGDTKNHINEKLHDMYLDYKMSDKTEILLENYVNERFAEKTNEMQGYACKCCGTEIYEDKDNENWFNEFGEEGWKMLDDKKPSLDEKIAGVDNIKSDFPKNETTKINKADKSVANRY